MIVPLGLPFFPILYSLYCIDLPTPNFEHTYTYEYADDTAYLTMAKSTDWACSILQSYIQRLDD